MPEPSDLTEPDDEIFSTGRSTSAAGSRTGGSDTDKAASRSRWRIELRAFAELFALCGIAIAQPLLDIFGKAPQHFIFRGSERGDILAFSLIIVFVAPIVLWVIGFVLEFISPRIRAIYHSLALWGLAAVVLTLVADGLIARVPALVVAILLAVGFILLYHRTRGPRIWLAFLSPAPIVFLAIFLLASPVAPLLRNPGGSLGTVVNHPQRTVVIVLDELSLPTLLDDTQEIDADLFPNFGRLADSSHWFREATTPANITSRAVPAILNGNPPEEGSTASAAFFPDNLFTLLGGAMPITSSEVVTKMCPSSVCEQMDVVSEDLDTLLRDARDVMSQRLDPRDPEVDVMDEVVEARDQDHSEDEEDMPKPFETSDPPDGGVERYGRFLDAIEDDDGLYFAHLLLPHTPYRLLPDGTVYPAEQLMTGRDFDDWTEDPTPVRIGTQRYLLQLQWVDSLIGQLIDHLEDEGLWEDTNVVVTADHGFAYEPGGPFRGLDEEAASDDTAVSEVMWVPLFVKTAGQTEGEISDDPVQNMDVTPTIAKMLDVDIPWDHEGRSVFDGGSGDPETPGMYLGNGDGGPNGTGPYRTLDRELARSLREDRTAHDLAPPADGVSGTDRIFRTGTHPELWGEAVDDDLPSVDFDPRDFSRADGVDTDSGELPARFVATTDDADVGTPVAISVNGTIWATTEVFEFESERRIEGILPVEAFQDGDNDLAVHDLSGLSD